MSSEAYRDQSRRIRQAEERDIVDDAFCALAAVPPQRRQELVDRWNRVFGSPRPNPVQMTWK